MDSHSIQYEKRHTNDPVFTVFAVAGGDSRLEISTLTDDQKALHTAKVNEVLNMDKFGVVDVVDRPQLQQVLSTLWVSIQRLDESYKVRLVARGFEQTVNSDRDFYAVMPKLTTLRALLTIAAIQGNPVAFGDCHSAFHESPMPSDSEPVYVERAPEAQLDSSKVWLCKKAFQGLKVSLEACGIHSKKKINDMSYNQWISGPSTYVKKRAQRSDDSILLRHMGGVVGTGPEEHLMSDFEHMKTSLYLTDVVVLCHEGDTVNFLGLEITKTRKGFEVKNSTDLVESLLKLYGLQNSKPTVNPGRRLTVMELASATPLDGHDYSNFRTAFGKNSTMAPWRPDMQFAIQQLSTQVINPTTESKRAVKHTCLRLEPCEMVQTGLLELVGRSDSDRASDSATGQIVTEYHCNVQNVTVVQPESETDSDQSQFM